LAIAWKAQPAADLVYIELASTEDGPLERVRCSFPNDGHALITATMLPKASAQSIAIHLVHREAVVAPGIDSGEIRFDSATSGSLRFEATPSP
jgi:hypothetical protein